MKDFTYGDVYWWVPTLWSDQVMYMLFVLIASAIVIRIFK